ncbi:hypothetical protein GCM10009718_23310 [Isoptericola halotolerans]|uniref:ScoMcrA-like N-terminal head domain-containing protein n=1 Tax=Isoptericola halotolerans TaxID=300560 RepID=A0ABX2A869_9MICO|nr:hypothetical protein [Isoptericola halotolerans]NOV98105.1 hypothetical protein [Isoptericola halotolerans]
MATFSSVTRPHVLSALAEHDDRGPVAFLKLYGFTPTPGVTLTYSGTTYDATAILAVAHRYATGRAALPEEMADGKVAVGALLRKRGFEIIGGFDTTAPSRRAPQRAAAAPRTRRAQEPEKPTPVCPTCFMALPATGTCDSCG